MFWKGLKICLFWNSNVRDNKSHHLVVSRVKQLLFDTYQYIFISLEMVKNRGFYVYSVRGICYSLFNLSPTKGYLDCYKISTVVSTASMSILKEIFVLTYKYFWNFISTGNGQTLKHIFLFKFHIK